MKRKKSLKLLPNFEKNKTQFLLLKVPDVKGFPHNYIFIEEIFALGCKDGLFKQEIRGTEKAKHSLNVNNGKIDTS